MITRLPALLALVLAPVLVTAANPVQVPAEVPVPDPDPPQVRSLSDISQEFTFYMDGRFHRQYLAANGGRDVRNWGSLGKADLEPFNLLLLTTWLGCAPQSGMVPLPPLRGK